MTDQKTETGPAAKQDLRGSLKRDLFRLSEKISLGATADEILQELTALQQTASTLLPDGQRPPQTMHSLEPGGADINIQQFWRHNDSGRIVQITNIQMGPVYRPGDTVTSWVPEKIFFRNIAGTDRSEQGLVVYFWRQLMTEIKPDEIDTIESSDAEASAAPERLYALVSTQGTAMSETALTESEFTAENRARIKAEPPADWDGGDFHDVSDNDAVREALDA